MKIVVLLSFLLALSFSFGQKSLKAYLSEKQFYTPQSGTYVEIQLQFAATSIEYLPVGNDLQGELEITQIIKKGDSIVTFDKYSLKSPLMVDSIVEDFYDIKRYALIPGAYKLELELKDANSTKEGIMAIKEFSVRNVTSEVSISDIQPAEVIRVSSDESNFYKMGYEVIPRISNYYPTELSQLPVYYEIYNTDLQDDSSFIVSQKIIDKNEVLDLSEYQRYYRIGTKEINALAKSIDISMLPQGSYFLEVSVINRDNKTIAIENFEFDRNNEELINEIAYEDIILDPGFNESILDDSIRFYIASLIPISNPSEVKNIIELLKKDITVDEQRKYFQAYWKKTSPVNTYETWLKYKQQVMLVERLYASNFQAGFETDRGRVFLQYGQPNSLQSRPNSPSEYPYEIWQYDKIGKYSNKRFVFYNPEMVNNAYRLLHSDMIGELQNNRWRYMLNSRNSTNNNIDDPTQGVNNHYGGNSSVLYNNY